MKRQLTITSDSIDEAALLRSRQMSAGMGAAVCFLGVVRGEEEGQAITAIEYESFQKMAEHQFNLLFDGMAKRWPIESVRLVHRVGVNLIGLAECPEFRSLWQKETLADDEVLKMAGLLENCGVREKVNQQSEELTQLALQSLETVFPKKNDYSEALSELAGSLLSRNY